MKGEGMRPAAGERGPVPPRGESGGGRLGQLGSLDLGIVAVGVAVALPAVVSSYQLSLMIRILLFAYLAGAWNILAASRGSTLWAIRCFWASACTCPRGCSPPTG